MTEKERHQNKRIDLGHGCIYENGEVKETESVK